MRMTCLYHAVTRRIANCCAIVALLLGLAGSDASLARAAVPAVLHQLDQALAAAQSFKLVVDQRTANMVGGMMSSHAEITTTHTAIVAVRHGTTLRLYASVATKTGSAPQTVTGFVYTGKHACFQPAANAPWTCAMPPAMATAYLDTMTPWHALARPGTQVQFSALGDRVIQGLRCVGYRFSGLARAGQTSTHGVLWVSSTTLRPVEFQTISSMPGPAGSTQNGDSLQSVWSRWNDPTLTIPAVGAS